MEGGKKSEFLAAGRVLRILEKRMSFIVFVSTGGGKGAKRAKGEETYFQLRQMSEVTLPRAPPPSRH